MAYCNGRGHLEVEGFRTEHALGAASLLFMLFMTGAGKVPSVTIRSEFIKWANKQQLASHTYTSSRRVECGRVRFDGLIV